MRTDGRTSTLVVTEREREKRSERTGRVPRVSWVGEDLQLPRIAVSWATARWNGEEESGRWEMCAVHENQSLASNHRPGLADLSISSARQTRTGRSGARTKKHSISGCLNLLWAIGRATACTQETQRFICAQEYHANNKKSDTIAISDDRVCV
ncbi:hypothetical protein BC835DRAFT_386566 [Cytidiella melzeri]|nr:hypothetical protein BC835DRAFT_386566 [Cytidiella melzeri]